MYCCLFCQQAPFCLQLVWLLFNEHVLTAERTCFPGALFSCFRFPCYFSSSCSKSMRGCGGCDGRVIAIALFLAAWKWNAAIERAVLSCGSAQHCVNSSDHFWCLLELNAEQAVWILVILPDTTAPYHATTNKCKAHQFKVHALYLSPKFL